jgi:hypothetical protein
MNDKKLQQFVKIMEWADPELDGLPYYVEMYGHCKSCNGTGQWLEGVCDYCDGLGAMFDPDNAGHCLCGRYTVNISHSYPTCTRCDGSRQVRKPKRKNYPDRYESPLL